MLFLRATA